LLTSIWSRISRRLTIAVGREPPPVMTADLLPQYRVGPGTYGVPQIIHYPNDASLEIGAYCSIAAEVSIFLGGEHHPEWVSTYPFGALWHEHQHPDHPRSRGNVVIGSDVWIGRGATIMSGIRVGDGAVIGARALVVKDVPPYTIVGGNPAKVIRPRFDAELVERLLEIRWWTWPEPRIRNAAGMLQSPDIRAFIDAVDSGRL
jgi:chloramphenicol O-acetyltransferase type B